MNNSKAGCSQSKQKLQMKKDLLKIRLIYNFGCIHHPLLLSIQIHSVIKSLNGKKASESAPLIVRQKHDYALIIFT